MLLKSFCEAGSVTGNERAIREKIVAAVEACTERCEQDRIGSLIAYKDGKPGSIKLLLSTHMDEVGAIVTGFLDDGYVKFAAIGNVDHRVWPAKRVLIGDGRCPGIVGIRSVHQQKPEQRKTNVSVEELYIDIGAESREEAGKIVRLADYIVFDSGYEPFGEQLAKAKAIGCRAGCAMIAELLQESRDVALIAAFTAQGEVGNRGAVVAANTLDYDAAIVIDVWPCDDAFCDEGEQGGPRLGGGPVLPYGKHRHDADGIRYDAIERIAQSCGVSLQRAVQDGADDDAVKLSGGKSAAPVLLLSLPCRNVRSPSEVINLQDYEACKMFVRQLLNEAHQWLRRE